MVKQVISGGQTGIDQLGLEVAKELGITTGGWAPQHFRTEDGYAPILAATYGLRDCGVFDYNYRTRANIQEADLTVVFGDVTSPGSQLTVRECEKYNKPVALNPTVTGLLTLLRDLSVQTLNVAGNRESKLTPARKELARTVLTEALRRWRDE